MRMRTLDQAINYIRSVDPETAVTKHALRQMLKDGRLPYVQVGKKHLVALETVDALFQLEVSRSKAPAVEEKPWM